MRKFNPEKFKTDAPKPIHAIKFITYKERDGFDTYKTFEDLEKDIQSGKIAGTVRKEICFATIRSDLANTKRNRILFKANFKHVSNKKLHLNREEIKRWIEDGAPIRVEGETKISGYSMFYTAFEFDEDGEFIRMGAWE